MPKLSVNGVSIGHCLLTLYQVYQDEKYLNKAVEMAEFLKNKAERFADGMKQYHGHEEFLQDPDTNLYYHGWDQLNQNHMPAYTGRAGTAGRRPRGWE